MKTYSSQLGSVTDADLMTAAIQDEELKELIANEGDEADPNTFVPEVDADGNITENDKVGQPLICYGIDV